MAAYFSTASSVLPTLTIVAHWHQGGAVADVVEIHRWQSPAH
jgi:hypothetical protein